MMGKNYKEALDNICDLIKLAKQSPMAYKYLLYEVKVVNIANSDEDPEFNQEDLSFHKGKFIQKLIVFHKKANN